MVPVTASTGPPGRNVGRRFIPIGTRVQLLIQLYHHVYHRMESISFDKYRGTQFLKCTTLIM